MGIYWRKKMYTTDTIVTTAVTPSINIIINNPKIFINDNSAFGNYNSDPCAMCSNNPANGGSGICHCTLGLLNIT